MPDAYHMVERAQMGLGRLGTTLPAIELLDMAVTDQSVDSTQAASLMREAGCACIIVLGGDGTVRVASGGAGGVPLLTISTGTNNVLPSFVEGTVAGLAAGALARDLLPRERATYRHKWIEIAVDGYAQDRALVDVAALAGQFVGARAIWGVADLRQLIVTRADAASIGISAIAAAICPVGAQDPYGLELTLGPGPCSVQAAVAPGLIERVTIAGARLLSLGESIVVHGERPLVIALDGEREIVLGTGQVATFTLRQDGPWIVDVARVMEALAADGRMRCGQDLLCEEKVP
jgi:predicted polyphosphate/ATP-dependent NAD kinase